MTERRVKKGHPDFERLFDQANEIAIAKNPQRWFNYANDRKDTPERRADIQEKKNEMEDELEGGIFKDYINGRKRR